jgi:hypothetical protein
MKNSNETHLLPTVPLDEHGAGIEAKSPSTVTCPVTIADARCKPRFKLQVDVTINSRTCGVLEGRSVDISESWMASMLRIEAPLGEVVELEFTLPCGPVTIYAMVRQKNAFRYGFQFLDTDSVHEGIRRTCHELATESGIFSKPLTT